MQKMFLYNSHVFQWTLLLTLAIILFPNTECDISEDEIVIFLQILLWKVLVLLTFFINKWKVSRFKS